MPSSATIVQSNSGSFTGTTGNATLGAGTTLGNTVILVVGARGATINTPSGFAPGTTNTGPGGLQPARIMHRSWVPASETSWGITVSVSAKVVWQVYEVSGLDEWGLGAGQSTNATATSIATSTSGTTTTTNYFVIGACLAYDSASTTPATWDWDGAVWHEELENGVAGGSDSLGMSSAWWIRDKAQPDTTATSSLGSAGPLTHVRMYYYTVETEAGGTYSTLNPTFCCGFEIGTTAGWATGNVGGRYVEAVAGSPAIVSTTPKSGTYCLELQSTAAAENVLWNAAPVSGLNAWQAFHFSVRTPASPPAADTQLFAFEAANGNVTVTYRTATQKLGFKMGTGTETASLAAVATDTWYDIDVRVDANDDPWLGSWRIDGAPQPPTTSQTGIFANPTWTGLRVGWTAAITSGPWRFDDVIQFKAGAAGSFPQGPHKVLVRKVDPAGTLTISGTTANFQTFTANGTLVAWNATTARTNISDIPPTIGASADGLVQVTLAASDYVEIPMEGLQVLPAGVIRCVRMLAPGWATTTTAATLGFRAYDGTTEHILQAGTVDPAFDNSTTAPGWVCKMVRTTAGGVIAWTQAMLDALCYRVGFSSDATPDVGIHAMYDEVAIKDTTTGPMFGTVAADNVLVEAVSDPLADGIQGLTVTAPEAAGGTLGYEVAGVPAADVYVAAGTVHTEVIEGANIDSVNRVTWTADPEGTWDT